MLPFVLFSCLFFLVKGFSFRINEDEGLMFFLPVWSLIVGAISFTSSFKYTQAKKAYMDAGMMDKWKEYKCSVIVKYSYLIAKVFLLALPVALFDFYFAKGEILGAKIPFLCTLFVVGTVSAIVYVLMKKKI